MLTTSIHLLERVRDHDDQAAWDHFVALYSPLLTRWTRQWGLSPHDSLDVVQDVLVALLRQLPGFQYDPARGHFRGWLKTLTWRLTQSRRNGRMSAGENGPPIDPPVPVDESIEESEHRAYLVRRALELMKGDFEETTWRACWENTVNGLSAAEVGRMLGLTEGAVYVAKCRVLRRLRQEMQGLLE